MPIYIRGFVKASRFVDFAKGIALASFRFLFKGSRVDGKLTCADIGLEDGDQLEAENAQDAVAARDE